MGTGFVLIIWLIIGISLGAIVSIPVGLLTWRYLKRASKGLRLRATIAAIALPPAAIISIFIGFLVYGIWCETIRDVDIGIGDSWRVPLGSGYQLKMVDIPEQAFIGTSNNTIVGLGLQRLGFDDKSIYLEMKSGQFLFIEKKNGKTIDNLTKSELDLQLRELASPSVSLRFPEDVYYDLRWSILDIVAGILILLGPCLLGYVVLKYVLRVRQNISLK